MPLFRRRRPLLRAAAVGGGAYAFGKHRERKQEDEQQQAYDEGQQAATTPGPAPAAPSGITDQDNKGSFYFDNSRGRLQGSDVKGSTKMKITSNGMEIVTTVDTEARMEPAK